MNISQTEWTPALVEEWVQIAAKTERALPSVDRPRMARPHIDYPTDWLSRLWDEIDEELKNREPKFQPTNEQVSMWEEVVLRWIPAIDNVKDRKILWWRSCGMGWGRIAKKIGVERHTPKRRYDKICGDLARLLNNGQITPSAIQKYHKIS